MAQALLLLQELPAEVTSPCQTVGFQLELTEHLVTSAGVAPANSGVVIGAGVPGAETEGGTGISIAGTEGIRG